MIFWGVKLKDEVSTPANTAAAAVTRLRDASGRFVATATMTADAMGRLRDASGRFVKSGQAAAASVHGMGEEIRHAHPHVSIFGHAWHELREQVQDRWRIEFDPIEWAKTGVEAVHKMVGAVTELISVGIEAAEEHERLVAVFGAFNDAMGSGAKDGAEIYETLNRLRGSVGMTTAEMAPFANKLLAAGVGAEDLASQLTAVATVKSINPEGVDKYVSLIEKLSFGAKVSSKDLIALQNSGINVREALNRIGYQGPQAFGAAAKAISASTKDAAAFKRVISEAVTDTGADALSAQANNLGNMWKIAKESVLQWFEAIDFKPINAAIKDFMSMFSETKPSGQVLKAVFVAAFTAIYKAATFAIILISKAFLTLMLVALTVAIFMKKHWSTFQPILIGVAVAISGMLIGAVIALTVAMWGLAAPVLAATWPFLLIGVAIAAVVAGIILLVKYWPQIAAFFSDLARGALEAGANFVEGLVGGITNGISRVVEAAKSMGRAAIGAIRNIFDSHSPSRLMFSFGKRDIAGSFGAGLEAGTPGVQESAGSMGSAAAGATMGASRRGRGGGDRTTHISFPGLVVQIDAGKATSPTEVGAMVEEGFMSLAERLAAMIGSAPDPA